MTSGSTGATRPSRGRPPPAAASPATGAPAAAPPAAAAPAAAAPPPRPRLLRRHRPCHSDGGGKCTVCVPADPARPCSVRRALRHRVEAEPVRRPRLPCRAAVETNGYNSYLKQAEYPEMQTMHLWPTAKVDVVELDYRHDNGMCPTRTLTPT